MTRTSLEIGGRESRLEIPNLQPIAGCLWTLVDVYGRLWMAPRAGFEVRRKWLNGHLPAGSRCSRYPRRYPTPKRTAFPVACPQDCWFGDSSESSAATSGRLSMSRDGPKRMVTRCLCNSPPVPEIDICIAHCDTLRSHSYWPASRRVVPMSTQCPRSRAPKPKPTVRKHLH